MAGYRDELDRMQHLMNYNINETKVSSKGATVEFHQEGADGKTYGIIKEGTKYYIKVAPKKDTEVLAEDYDYIGGYMNKKEYEYNSYPLASRQLDLKLMSVNEACEGKKARLEQFKPMEDSEWTVNETREMRAEINRFNQLTENVNNIIEKGYINENSAVGVGLGNVEKKAGPYEENGETKDLNGKVKKTSERKQGVTDGEKSTDEKPTKPETEGSISKMKPGESTYTEKPKIHNIKINEEQALAWQHERAFVHTDDDMDRSNGTEIGDSAPYSEKVGCEKSNQCGNGIKENAGVFHNTDDQESPKKGTGDAESEDPYTEKVNEELPFPEVEEEGEEETIYEVEINESELHDFGNHPAYRKAPFTLPKNSDGSEWGRDWNDKSTKGEQPYGQRIGAGDPYTEKVVDMLTDAIMDKMYGKKKI